MTQLNPIHDEEMTMTTKKVMLMLVRKESGQTKARQSHSRPAGLNAGVGYGQYTTTGALVSSPNYRRVFCRIWESGSAFAPMAPALRDIASYAMTSPQTNPIGCFPFSERLAATQLGYRSLRLFRTRFAAVRTAMHWDFDESTTVLAIAGWAEDNLPHDTNNTIHWRSWFEEVPDCAVKARAHAEVCRLLAANEDKAHLLGVFLGSPKAAAQWRRINKSFGKPHECEEGLG